MKRRRLNLKLLAGLLLGSLGLAVAVWVVHRLQVQRNARHLLQLAEDAEELGELRDAAGHLHRYVNLRREDEQAYSRWANLVADIALRDDASPREVRRAFQVLPAAVRRVPDDAKLRRRLVDFFLAAGRTSEARDHLDVLRSDEPPSPELEVLYAGCLIEAGEWYEASRLLRRAIGYDEQTRTYDPESAVAARHVEAYLLLANLLLTELEQPEDADGVMNQLVAVNAKNHRALLERGRYHLRRGRLPEARADIRRATELNPKSGEVLLAAAELAAGEGNFQQGRELLERGLESTPDDYRLYRALAILHWQKEDPEQALIVIERGLKRAAEKQPLLAYQAHLQLHQKDLEGARQTIGQMRAGDHAEEIVELFEAQILLVERQWVDAARALEELRTKIARQPELVVRLNVYLGRAYERLGQPDQALEAYRLALRSDGRSVDARRGVERTMAALGRADTNAPTDLLSGEVAAQLKRPEEQRDWSQLEKLIEELTARDQLTPAMAAIVRARLAAYQGQYADADKILDAALRADPDEINLWLHRARFARLNPAGRKEAAMGVLTEARRRLGDRIALRLAEGALLLTDPDNPQLASALGDLAENRDAFSPGRQSQLLTGLFTLAARAGLRELATQFLEQAVQADPQNLPARMQMLEWFRETNQLAGLRRAIGLIRELVGEDDPAAQYAKAVLLVLQAADQAEAEPRRQRLAGAEALIKTALATRPGWHELHRLKANLHLLRRETESAIAAYSRAFELGPPHPLAVRRQVELLSVAGRFDEAQQTLELLRPQQRNILRPDLQAEVHLRSGQVEQALEVARKAVAENEENYLSRLWYGQLMLRAGRAEEAEHEFRKATELAPQVPQAWLAWITYLVRTGKHRAAEEALSEARGALGDSAIPVFLAKAYEQLGNAQAAADAYRQALEADPENLPLLSRAANFYLGEGGRSLGRQARGEQLLERILKVAGDRSDSAIAAWARRQKARRVAARGTYPDLVAARALIDENRAGGELRENDKLALAQILAARPEAVSRREAVRLLQEVAHSRPLGGGEQLLLARLYDGLGDWERCRVQMLNLLDRQPGSRLALSVYIRLLLARKLYDQAERHVRRLEELAPGEPATQEIRALWLAGRGRRREATELLLRLAADAAPQENGKRGEASQQPETSSGSLERQLRAAALLREIGGDAEAEKLLRSLAPSDGRAKLALAELIGNRGELEAAFAWFEKTRGDLPPAAVVASALRVVQSRGSSSGRKFFGQIERWLQAAPATPATQLQLAALRALQGEHDKEAAIYRALLAADRLSGNQRALVLNNLAFNLAFREQGNREALELINRAIELRGPTGALLDTRAMVSYALGDYQRAVSDLNLALADQPKAIRFFHLALAEQALGHRTAARRHLSESMQRGLVAERVSELERPYFDRLVKELALSGGSEG